MKPNYCPELNRQGLLAETTLLATPDQEILPAPMLSQPVERYSIPGAAGFSISGSDLSQLRNTNLNQLWTQVSAKLSGSGYDAISRLINQPLAALQARWGIDHHRISLAGCKGNTWDCYPCRTTTPDWILWPQIRYR